MGSRLEASPAQQAHFLHTLSRGAAGGRRQATLQAAPAATSDPESPAVQCGCGEAAQASRLVIPVAGQCCCVDGPRLDYPISCLTPVSLLLFFFV